MKKNRREIKEIAKNAQEWIQKHPNATEAEIKEYTNSLYKMLGTHTNFKFSVWVVAGYGVGFGFKEYGPSQKTPTSTPGFQYMGSYLKELDRPKNRRVDASSHQTAEWGKEIKTGNISNVLNRFKQTAKDQEEEEKRLLELRRNKPVINAKKGDIYLKNN